MYRPKITDPIDFKNWSKKRMVESGIVYYLDELYNIIYYDYEDMVTKAPMSIQDVISNGEWVLCLFKSKDKREYQELNKTNIGKIIRKMETVLYEAANQGKEEKAEINHRVA